MSESHNQTYLALTRNQDDLHWLQGALAPLGQVIGANGPSLDELLALVLRRGDRVAVAVD